MNKNHRRQQDGNLQPFEGNQALKQTPHSQETTQTTKMTPNTDCLLSRSY